MSAYVRVARLSLAVLLCAAVCSTSLGSTPSSDPHGPYSSDQLAALVGPVALYPDSVVEQVLVASQFPYAIQMAAASTSGDAAADALPEAVAALKPYPLLLQELAADPVRTTRLGHAAQVQLADVWQAVDAIRQQVDSASQQVDSASQQAAEATAATTPVATAYGIPGYATAPLAEFWAGVAAAEIYEELSGAYTVYGTPVGCTHVVTTATGGQGVFHGGSAVVTDGSGNAAYGAAATGSFTTAGGQTFVGAGEVHGTVTRTADGGSYDKQSSAAVGNVETGNWAAGKRDSSGSVQQNADGSVSFSRDAHTQTSSSAGASNVQHQSSGTYAGAGNSSYSGSTTIDSTHGSASVSTTAGQGQVSTTITTSQGSQTVTAGNGTALESGSAATSTSSAARTTTDSTASSMSRSAAERSAPWSFSRPNNSVQRSTAPTLQREATPSHRGGSGRRGRR